MRDMKELPRRVPPQVRDIAGKVAREGGELYIVGGWIRDQLLGIECHDVDLASDLDPGKVKDLVKDMGSVFDMGEKFGTVGVRIEDYTIEITTYRQEDYAPGSRHPAVTAVADIGEDLLRRDFTMNALALSVTPEQGKLLDPFGGIEDMRRGLIRTPMDPAESMGQDPLRMMRAVRFSAQLGYEIEGELMDTLRREAGLLQSISRERIRDEFERILVSQRPDAGIRKMVETGLMDYVVVEISEMQGVDQPRAYHRADVLEHTLLTMRYLEPDPLLRRAALFHDVGKPRAKVTSPRTMFPEHEKTGEDITLKALKGLRYGNSDIKATVFLVRHHMRPIRYESGWSDAAVRRFIRDCTLTSNGDILVPLQAVFDLARADIKAGNLEKAPRFLDLMDELEERVEGIRAQLDIEKVGSPLDGRRLMSVFGREPGPWIGRVKEHLTELVISGELDPDDENEAVERARLFIERKREEED